MIALVVGVIGIAGSVAAFFVDSHQFMYSYLTAFSFWVSIGLGGLFFTMIHHLANATWSVVVRRLIESVMAVLPVLIVFFIPIALGLTTLYHWTDTTAVAADHLLTKKAGFLNTWFFVVRTIVYFAIWGFLAYKLYRISLDQDKGHNPNMVARWRKISAPGMILFAVTLTYASFDWIMSLDPHWYSTIFGAYYFAGAAMGAMAFTAIMVVYLTKKNVLADTITVEHRHDIAKLTFAFLIFWAYMAFSQYFLIWYANIPEETIWYQYRWEGSWKTISLIIVIGHFAVPFLMLITRAAKRSANFLMFVAVYMLVMHYIDIYWLVLPNLFHHGPQFSWMDLVSMMAIGGPFVWYFWKRFTSAPLIPVGDPRLSASINFVNN